MNATSGLIELLNDALSREMRSQAMYAHYAAYVKGIHRLHLKPCFESEAAESTLKCILRKLPPSSGPTLRRAVKKPSDILFSAAYS